MTSTDPLIRELVEKIYPNIPELLRVKPRVKDVLVGKDIASNKIGLLIVEDDVLDARTILEALGLPLGIYYIGTTFKGFSGPMWTGLVPPEVSLPSKSIVTIEQVRVALAQDAGSLNKSRPGVSMIMADHNREKGGKKYQENCIAVYVKHKGFLVLGEAPLPKSIRLHDGTEVSIDVRTGSMLLF